MILGMEVFDGLLLKFFRRPTLGVRVVSAGRGLMSGGAQALGVVTWYTLRQFIKPYTFSAGSGSYMGMQDHLDL